MSTLIWTQFNALAGSRSQNFENLCRGLMRLHFGSTGEFRALKNQPGVEFHLKLIRECPTLGAPPRWWGWQCKIHELTVAGHLRASSKQDIQESLRTTEQHLPDLTDWALWTPYSLSKDDQAWFKGLGTKMELHLWAEEEVDTYLSGPGIILRSTYFGDLIATPEELEQRHRESVQPIKERWFEPVHQITEAERTLRRMLGEPGSWQHLVEVGKDLQDATKTITEFVDSIDPSLTDIVAGFVASCEAFGKMLLQFHEVLADGDLEIIQQQLRERQSLLDDKVKATPRQLRRLGVSIALDATNALHNMRIAQSLLSEVEDYLAVSLVAVLADAGGGKTQLAAAVTSPTANRPAGVLLHGRNLHRGQNLNDLATTCTLNGSPIAGFEKLMAALDAVAKRSRCRLPLIIDGLNEAENPQDWKAPLASISEAVKAYPNILLVCTLRTGERRREDEDWVANTRQNGTSARESFAVMALPSDIRLIESEGFGADTSEAVERYFDHFNIAAARTEIPIEFLRHPLTLRIFCQVTNPTRQSKVQIAYFPASLNPLFEQYLENSALRIAELPNLSHSYSKDDVLAALHRLGEMLWAHNTRHVRERALRDAIGDTGRPWQCSIVNLLAQEGLIFRNPGPNPYEYVVTPAYDALGGFMIANSLLTTNSRDRSFDWLAQPESIAAFRGDHSHELASDIFRALVALTPTKMAGSQLWKTAPEIFRDSALKFTADLNPEYLDNETIEALLSFYSAHLTERTSLYSRLISTSATVNHPLNADFLDRFLRPATPVGERDLSWTEWIRATRNERLAHIFSLERMWRSEQPGHQESDHLRAKCLMWHLTSTDRKLRDITTRALYYFGRKHPSSLFDECLESLSINDPYVPERMLAAAYGAAMSLRATFESTLSALTAFSNFSKRLHNALFSNEPTCKTTHILLREYAMRIVELAALHAPSLFSDDEIKMATPPFHMADLSEWGAEEEHEHLFTPYSASPFGIGFENHTLGRLVPDRHNYDFDNSEYKKTRERVLWRVKQLGWTSDKFEEIDRQIVQRRNYSNSVTERNKIDRYGKKYSLTAYLEMSGLLHDLGVIDQTHGRERTSDVDIDPSFPHPVLKASFFDADLLGPPSLENEKWITHGEMVDMAPFLRTSQIGIHNGSWITLDGFVVQQDENRGRRSFCFVRSFIVKNSLSSSLEEHLLQQDLSNQWLPDNPSVIYTFSGEIPWCKTYPQQEPVKLSFVVGHEVVVVKKSHTVLYIDGAQTDPRDLDPNLLLRLIDGDSSGEMLANQDIGQLELRDMEFDAEEVRNRVTEFEATIPVCEYRWEGRKTAAHDAGHATILAKELADKLDLINRPHELDLFTRGGARATLNTSDKSQDFNNHQSFFFIREDLLQSYLQGSKSTLIWAIWGHREYSTKLANTLFHGPHRPTQIRGDLKQIRRYQC